MTRAWVGHGCSRVAQTKGRQSVIDVLFMINGIDIHIRHWKDLAQGLGLFGPISIPKHIHESFNKTSICRALSTATKSSRVYAYTIIVGLVPRGLPSLGHMGTAVEVQIGLT